MAPINIIYISIEGNTRAFIKRLSAYAEQQHAFNNDKPLINAKEISDQTIPETEKEPFFVFVPTYLPWVNTLKTATALKNASASLAQAIGTSTNNIA